MGNISKARANITTAKTEALKIYTPPDMQGELDLQSGMFALFHNAYMYKVDSSTWSLYLGVDFKMNCGTYNCNYAKPNKRCFCNVTIFSRDYASSRR